MGLRILPELISDDTVAPSIRATAKDLLVTYPPPDQIL